MMSSTPTPLFHYCSSENFLSILRQRQIIASSLTLSNDTMEGKWIEKILSELCAIDSDLTEHKNELVNLFKSAGQLFSGFGFCLSEAGDLLSQWRGYADNGSGVSIGFNPEYLTRIIQGKGHISLQRIIYDEVQQKEFLKPLIDLIKKYVMGGALEPKVGSTPLSIAKIMQIDDAYASLRQTLLFATPDIYKLKNPAFSEEKEWRVLDRRINIGARPNAPEIAFKARGDRISPITIYDLKGIDVPAISEVFLGPKHITPISVVADALSKFGFENVKVSRSTATYR
jgi:hypothetical protein